MKAVGMLAPRHGKGEKVRGLERKKKTAEPARMNREEMEKEGGWLSM